MSSALTAGGNSLQEVELKSLQISSLSVQGSTHALGTCTSLLE